MAGLGVALRQIRADIASLTSFFGRIWDAKNALSSKSRPFYLLGLFGFPLLAITTLPFIVSIPFTLFVLLCYDGCAAMISGGQQTYDTSWRRL